MHDSHVISIKTLERETREFPSNIGLHQGSTLSSYMFSLIMDELAKHIQDKIFWCIFFADDVALINESGESVHLKLEINMKKYFRNKEFQIK